jgi:hypothetical protein
MPFTLVGLIHQPPLFQLSDRAGKTLGPSIKYTGLSGFSTIHAFYADPAQYANISLVPFGLLYDLTLLLNPELVHRKECVRMFVLKDLPLTKVGGGTVIRETLLISVQDISFDFKPHKLKIVPAEKCVDVRQSHTMFLNME